MKRVFSNSSMVAHVWAQRSQDNGRTGTGNMHFNSDAIFSYGSHFPLAKFLNENTVLINSDDYSAATSKHKAEVRHALPSFYSQLHTNTAIIKHVVNYHSWLKRGTSHKKNLVKLVAEEVRRVIIRQAETASKRRKASLKERDIGIALNFYDDSEKLLHIYKAKMPAAILNLREKMQSDLTGLITLNEAQLKAAKAKHDRQQAAMRKEKATKALEFAAKWLTGETLAWADMHLLRDYHPVLLRVTNEIIETSLGAQFPITHAIKAWPMIRSCKVDKREWETNGRTIHLGNFKLQRIEADGKVIAGCHVVHFDQIERIAKELKIA